MKPVKYFLFFLAPHITPIKAPIKVMIGRTAIKKSIIPALTIILLLSPKRYFLKYFANFNLKLLFEGFMKFIIMLFKIILSYKNVSLYAYSLYLGIRVIMCKCFEKNTS